MQRIYETSKLSFTRVGIIKDCELDSCEVWTFHFVRGRLSQEYAKTYQN